MLGGRSAPRVGVSKPASRKAKAQENILAEILFGDLTTCPQGKIRYIFHMSVKEQVLQAIQRLPNDIDFRDVTDEVALLAAVQEAERDIEGGRLVSNEEMKSRIAQWSAR